MLEISLLRPLSRQLERILAPFRFRNRAAIESACLNNAANVLRASLVKLARPRFSLNGLAK